MIKLESKSSAQPQVLALFAIVSASKTPAVMLSCADVQEKIGDEWKVSTANTRQTVSGFMDGKPFMIAGKVSQEQAVVIDGACFKAVCEVEVKTALTQAYEKGDRSREMLTISLLRVVEVWETAEKCLWRARDSGNGASPVQVVELGADRKPISRESLTAGARS